MTNRLASLTVELTLNFVAPWLTFKLLEGSIGDTGGLIASAMPPLLWSLIEFARARRMDALSVIVLVGILLTLAATLLGGSPRLMQVRENAVTGLIGVVCLSTAWLERPLIYYLAYATYGRSNPQAAVQLMAFGATAE